MRWLALAALGCAGGGDDPTSPAKTPPTTTTTTTPTTTTSEPVPDHVTTQPLRRLTTAEYDATVQALLDDPELSGAGRLPEDFLTPFDNDAATQTPSRVLVEAVEALARDAAQALVSDPERLDAWLPCAPTGPDDAACLTETVEWVGRLALHRPLTADEVDALVELGLDFAARDDAFATGVEVVLRALLQDPELLYRIEVGTPLHGHPDVERLDDYQIAARASALLWGAAPDDWLLDQADAGLLASPDSRAEVARQMLDDPRARDQVDRFHALWLGYEDLSVGLISTWTDDTLADAFRLETRMLVERVVFDEPQPWRELLLTPETWLSPELAAHYDLPGDGWTDVSAWDRGGLLGQGSFLAVAGNVLDTSPTRRGKLVRERLMCAEVPPPPPEIEADSPPDQTEGECKLDRYEQHRADPACAGCHELTDAIGFGLENYDLEGRFRAHDYRPETTNEVLACPIDGDGEIVGVGTFSGPAELAALLVDADLVEPCLVQHLVQYTRGRAPSDDDLVFAAELADTWPTLGSSLDELLVAIVATDAFGYRRLEEAP